MTDHRVSSSCRALLLAFATVAAAPQAHADLLWSWDYSGTGIAASGTLKTGDAANAEGFYSIVAITGTRNGDAITGLQATGTPIPGNEPFAVDNLLGTGARQLTVDGFGFSTAHGNYASPFYADFLPTPGYLEFFSAPPFTTGTIGPEDSELPISFHASMVSAVPEPGTLALFSMAGVFFSAVTLRRRKVRGAG